MRGTRDFKAAFSRVMAHHFCVMNTHPCTATATVIFLALGWGEFGVGVNGIGAGWITTSSSDSTDILDRYLPSRHRGHPTDLCGLLVYLASESCDFVTGTTINIDGGALAHA